MAQTKRKRKHRGTAAGTIEKAAHNRSTKQAAPKKPDAKATREARLSRPPSWRSAANKAGIASIVFGVLLLLVFKRPVAEALVWTVVVFFFYTPIGYWTDRAVYNRRMRSKAKNAGR
jgi:multisubunit Na+/H+ antiporter MnhG subunit